MRKYLSLLAKDKPAGNEELTNKELADRAYNSDEAAHNAERLRQLICYLKETETELSKTGVPVAQLRYPQHVNTQNREQFLH